uniref:Uncharacterized protein n=1 Tax=Romanomermis culicivorax TaxID=13658 RepID=A0A915J0I2_ROMCU
MSGLTHRNALQKEGRNIYIEQKKENKKTYRNGRKFRQFALYPRALQWTATLAQRAVAGWALVNSATAAYGNVAVHRALD